MPKKIRVVTGDTPTKKVIAVSDNVKTAKLTENELKARFLNKYSTTTMGYNMKKTAGDVLDSVSGQFYSPQLSTDFLEKPQNLRERRAFYRFFYNTNEIVGRAVDIHSELPISKIRLVPPKSKNRHQSIYVQKFFEDMCDNMKLFESLIEVSHDYHLMGNCLHRSAEINKLGGIEKAENIKVGDLILTDKGRYRRVIKTCSRESKDIFKIKCIKDFREIPVTGDHPIEIFKNNEFIFEKAENIKIGDYIRVTWPDETEDIESINLSFPPNYEILEDGVRLNFKIPHVRDIQAYDARKKILSWINSLTEPVIITREKLAEKLGINLRTFHSVVYFLEHEFKLNFRKRIGAKGYQEGSQVVWFYQDTSNIEVTESYTMNLSRKLPSIKKLDINNDFCYLAGYWLGDGTIGTDSSRNHWGRGLWQINFKNDSYENINRVEKILIDIFGVESIKKWDSDGMTYLKVNSNPAFIEWWSDNFGRSSLGKRQGLFKKVPQWFSKLPKEKLQYFLAGILDSDGYCSGYKTGGEIKIDKKNNAAVSISMISRNVMDSVRDAALKCGAVVNYRKSKEYPVVTSVPRMKSTVIREMYIISASDKISCDIITKYSNKRVTGSDIRYSNNRNNTYVLTDDGKLAFKVKKMTHEEYNDLVYNFEVEEDHTYQVAGFSTHNCFIYAENTDLTEGLSPEEVYRKKEEAKQKSEFLKQKYDIKDSNPLYKGWRKLLILPPDQVRVRKIPLSDSVAIEYQPDPETRKFLMSDINPDPSDPSKNIEYNISEELREKVRQSGIIPMDTDPYSGSHVHHLARKKSQYESLGVSVLERCVNTLVYMDKLRQAQTSIASRHMTPFRIVWSDGLSNDQVDNLREQVDLALIDPDFSIIANYEVHWEEMGSEGRILNLENEYTGCTDRLLAGLGMTREILTGEGSYSGSRISLEIMNTQYLLFRERIQEYVENYLFKPIARKKGFIEYDDYGNEVLIYPKLSFTRLSIRDNDHFFDSVFQLYQKGSVSIDLILDILNIDPQSTREKIEKDLFTVNDSMFNEIMRNIYTSAAATMVEKTDVSNRIAEYLKLNFVEPEGEPEGTARFSSEKGGLDKDRLVKLSKLMNYMKNNPKALDKIFSGEKNGKNII